MKSAHIAVATSLVAIAFASGASASSNVAPPAGAILDLSGLPIPFVLDGGTHTLTGTAPVLASVTFQAGLGTTDIGLAFRDDPSAVFVWNVSLVDVTKSSSNLLTNGDFTGGVYTSNGNASAPNGWIYGNPSASTGNLGYALNPCLTLPGLSGACWVDPLGQVYDTLDQTVTTTPGDRYTLSFYYGSSTDTNGTTTFADTSTTGNAVDILAYASGATPVPVPAALWCLLSGLGGLAALSRRRLTATT